MPAMKPKRDHAIKPTKDCGLLLYLIRKTRSCSIDAATGGRSVRRAGDDWRKASIGLRWRYCLRPPAEFFRGAHPVGGAHFLSTGSTVGCAAASEAGF